MALLLLNNAEAQASGTAVATDGSNTGGTNSDAFTSAIIGANMTLTFDNAVKAHGSNGYKLALTAAATANVYVQWILPSAVSRLYGAWYWAANRYPATSSVRHVQFFNGNTLIGSFFGPESGTGQFSIRDNVPATLGTVTGNIFSASTVYRMEFDLTFDAVSGSGTLNAYLGDSTTLLGQAAFSGSPFGNGVSSCDKVRFGICTANYSSTSGDWLMIDSLNVNDTGMPGPGPYTAAPPPQLIALPAPSRVSP